MRALVLLLLLATTAARAQTVHPSEITYGPFDPGPRDHSFAIAVAQHGMLLAWSEMDPDTRRATIHTGLLNFDGQLIGPINKLPALRGDMHATTPKVITDGTTFLVTWVDRDRTRHEQRRVAGVYTNSDGVPTTETRSFGVKTTPGFIWDGQTYRVYENFGARVLFATPEATGWINWYALQPRRDCLWDCPGPVPYTEAAYELFWTVTSANWTRTNGLRETGYVATAPAVTATGTDLLIVWSSNRGLKALRVNDGRIGVSFELKNDLAAGTTVSMADQVVVFEHEGDIYGSIITEDAFGEPFPISTGIETDALPRIYRAGDRYLVTYVREHASRAVSLVGRFVSISP